MANSPTQGMWECRHGVDGRDYCPECYGPEPRHDLQKQRESHANKIKKREGP